MDFEKCFERYAELLVSHGANIQPGQQVLVGGEAIHRDLLMLIAEEAYKRGARYVEVDIADPRLSKIRLTNSATEDLSFVPGYVSERYKALVDSGGATIRLTGSEKPDILSDVNPKDINSMRMGLRKAIKYFYDEGIGKSGVHWTLAAAATPEWGLKLFPDAESPEEANRLLWEQIFKICRVDTDDYSERWKAHNEALKARESRLNELDIRSLHFTGPGTDLTVGLSDRAKFIGGTDMGPHGVTYEPNIPTEECFTTPNYHLTRGKVRATRPFMINGKLIRDLEVEFVEGGVISEFSASEGQETFAEYINSDEGAKRLGEVALVGTDSPIFQSGLVFEEILYDENAACHIAVGSAYKFCIEGGNSLSEEELKEIGCNESSVHTDMMISSEEVDVHAELASGDRIELIKGGQWVDF